MSRTRLGRVGILGHTGRASVRKAARRLNTQLLRWGCDVRVDTALAEEIGIEGVPPEELGRWCQLLVTLGGDGTALLGAHVLLHRKGVLLPINLGGLGFLSAGEATEMGRAVRNVLEGRWPVRARSGIRAVVHRRGKRVYRGTAVNDVVLKSAGNYTAIHVRVHALGADLGRLVADGLIAATATGSTAYSLSAGGPVIAPGVEAVLMTPVAAHSLGTRPLVLGPDDDVRVAVIGANDAIALLLDGRPPFTLAPRDEVELRLVRGAVRIAENPKRPLARSLRLKLGWQGSAKRSF